MENITTLYQAVFQELMAVRQQAEALKAQRQQEAAKIQSVRLKVEANYAQKKKQLENDLKTAEGYLTQTITLFGGKIPSVPAQNPDFVRMQQLFVCIDSPGSPEIQQLLKMAAGAAKYLKEQLNNLAKQEARDIRSSTVGIGGDAKQDDALILQKYQNILNGTTVQRLANAVHGQNQAYFVNSKETYDLQVPVATSEILRFGVVQRPFPVPEALEPKLQSLFGVYYDGTSKTLRLPFGFRSDRGVKIMIRTPESMKARVQRALSSLCFNLLRHNKPLSGRVVYVDPATYNPEHLGIMKHFAGQDQMISFPVSDAQVQSALGRLIDAGSKPGNQETRYLILRGYPGGLSGAARDKICKICNNSAQYRITVIMTEVTGEHTALDKYDTAAMSDALQITADGQHYYMEQAGVKNRFAFFVPPTAMTGQMCRRFQDAYMPRILGSKYPERISLKGPAYQSKGKRMISIPYGVDNGDQLCELDFSNTNFSMYLMGAAGSGKSTLLHSIITGIMRNYHPDDVELWLADFKMSEFSQYMDPMPPHIKYILLDESAELVYDFVELLTQEMIRRKQFFSRHPEYKKVEALSDHVYMPTIFVIIDEFSLMSQVIQESDHYKNLLTNLLTEGRALGFKFIFSSQEYSKGVRGLSGAARDQVQTRMAMKNTTEEIKETLDIPSTSMTDQIRQWIDSLPPHVALYKHYNNATRQTDLTRAQVLYFPDGYLSQKQMIEAINRQLRRVTRYAPGDLNVYVDKHPVVADGSSFHGFSGRKLKQEIDAFIQAHPEDVFKGDVFFSPGDPRRLISGQLVQLTDENRENLLLITGREQTCAMSVMQSAAKAMLMQGGEVQVWSYRRNRIYKRFGGGPMANYQCFHDTEDIAAAIEELKQNIQAKKRENQLIVLLGMDRILEDLESLAESEMDEETATGEALDASTGELDVEEVTAAVEALDASTPEEEARYKRMLQFIEELGEDPDDDDLSTEEYAEKMKRSFALRGGKEVEPKVAEAKVPAEPKPIRKKKPNYLEDLRYIVNRGCNYGYHFLLCVEEYSKLRASKLNSDMFRHKISFCIGVDDAEAILGRKRAAYLPEHVGLYHTDTKEYTFRPYLHKGIVWDGWELDSNGNAVRHNY